MNPRLASPRSSTSAIEILEARVAPAGLVTATFAGGILTLTGDTAGNELAITFLGQDIFRVAGDHCTALALSGAPAVATLAISRALASVKADMGVGDDVLALSVITTTGAVSFDGGDGHDTLTITNSQIGGALTFLG